MSYTRTNAYPDILAKGTHFVNSYKLFSIKSWEILGNLADHRISAMVHSIHEDACSH